MPWSSESSSDLITLSYISSMYLTMLYVTGLYSLMHAHTILQRNMWRYGDITPDDAGEFGYQKK